MQFFNQMLKQILDHLFCDSNLNGTTDQDLKRSMHTVNTFWFFPYKTTESSKPS